MKRITRTGAIKRAQASVTPVYAYDGGYRFTTHVGTQDLIYTGTRYHATIARSQALIDNARLFMGLDTVQYKGGNWLDYIPQLTKQPEF